MAKTLEKLTELKYDELTTLGVIEQNEDLTAIFTEEINMPFKILYRLQKEGKLNDKTKELLAEMFEKVILTRKDFVEKYQRLSLATPIEVGNPIETITQVIKETKAPVVEPTKEVVVEVKTTKVKKEKEVEIPRRYGADKIRKDIEAQGGKATPVQRASMSTNTLKNLYVNINRKLIKTMLTDKKILSDEDCRKISSAITTFERQINELFKK
jgi:hypothetical protein